MFFTDHGEYLGDHGLVEKWPTGMSDVLTRNHILIAGANLPSNNTFSHMVDLLPTVFQLCSIPTSFHTNGKSWLPSMMEPDTPHKDYAFVEAGCLKSEEPLIETSPFPYDIKADLQHEDPALVGRAIAIRSQEWTFVYRLCEPAELYSRADDPAELHNLAARPEYQHVVRMLDGVLLKWQVETSDFLPWKIDPRLPEIVLEDPGSQWLKRANKDKILD